MTTPQAEPPKSTNAQKWTAAMTTPVGIIAALILLPLVLCCGIDIIGNIRGHLGR